MKPFLAIIFVSILLAGIACGSSATPISDRDATSTQAAEQSATKTPFPTSAPTVEPTATKTATPVSTQTVEPTSTKTATRETIGQAARITMPGVPIVERGGIGAQAAERATIQAAIDTMMTDNLLATVAANGTADYIRAEGVAATDTDFGGGQYIVNYVRDPFTAYCYTWSANGTILAQVVPGTAPCAATP